VSAPDAREDVAMHRRGVRQFQGARTERRLLTELLDEYERHADVHYLKSLAQIRSRMKRLRAAFSGYRALAVTHDVLLAYRQTRQQEGAAHATIYRELEVVSRAYALAIESGKLAYAPKVPSLREDNARSGFFERADSGVPIQWASGSPPRVRVPARVCANDAGAFRLPP